MIQDAHPEPEPEAEPEITSDPGPDPVADAAGDPERVELDPPALDDEEDEDDVDAHESDKPDEVSPSPALDIEGVVIGEAENAGVQSEGGQPMPNDTDEV